MSLFKPDPTALLFALHRAYNRSLGKYVLNWDHESLSLFGYNFILKRTLAQRHDRARYDALRAGLCDADFDELLLNLAILEAWPRPHLPGGNYTQQQRSAYRILTLFDTVHVHRHTIYPSL
jgi:hypothetical protein